MKNLLRLSVFAGIAIGIAGFGYLAAGVQSEKFGSALGAILFSFGLLTVVGYKLKLYTGTAGFINKKEVGDLFLVLFGNIVGCFCIALKSHNYIIFEDEAVISGARNYLKEHYVEIEILYRIGDTYERGWFRVEKME